MESLYWRNIKQITRITKVNFKQILIIYQQQLKQVKLCVIFSVQIEKLIVVGDVGGTNLRLAVYDQNIKQICKQTYNTQLIETIALAIKQLLEENQIQNKEFISCCIAIAGPINHYKNPDYDTCKITNKKNNITDSTVDIQNILKCKTTFINDFEAIGYYILSNDQDKQIYQIMKQDQIDLSRPICIIGAGTGLGFGFIVNNQVISSEGGHTTFSPQNLFDFNLLQQCQQECGTHVSWERILSGSGIQTLFYTLLNITSEQAEQCRVKIDYQKIQQEKVKYIDQKYQAKQISQLALQNEFIPALTMKIWFFYYGRAIYDNIATFIPGQFYIAGGIMGKNIQLIKQTEFSQEFFKGIFENGRTAKLAKNVEINVLINESVGLQGSLFKAQYQ